MGTRTRSKPARLADKLRQIRISLGLSQNGLVNHLGLQKVITYNRISNYEQASREPPLPILLAYARAAGVCVDVLIDDELELPNELPATPVHREVNRPTSKRPARKSKS
jgi:transcriptional regulator with XRE-family HTH domain